MNESDMNNSSETNWALVDSLTDEMVDRSEVPPLDESFFARAACRIPEGQEVVAGRVDSAPILNRQIEARPQEIAADARASIAAFLPAKFKAYSAEELIAELRQSLEDQVELPSDAGIPNAVTQRTFAETDAGEDMVQCEDAQDMFARLGI